MIAFQVDFDENGCFDEGPYLMTKYDNYQKVSLNNQIWQICQIWQLLEGVNNQIFAGGYSLIQYMTYSISKLILTAKLRENIFQYSNNGDFICGLSIMALDIHTY